VSEVSALGEAAGMTAKECFMITRNGKTGRSGWRAGFLSIALWFMAATAITMSGCTTFQAIVVTPPAKTVFGQGEMFSYEGLRVTGITTKGETEDLSGDSRLKVTGYDPARTGDQTITVDHRGVTATYTVTVVGVENISIEKTQVTARQGMDIDRSTLRITASYGDRIAPLPVQGDAVKISGYNKDSPGVQTVTADYYGKTAAFTVTVAALTGIRITKPPAKTAYLSGDPLDLAGLEATASWQNSGEAPVTPKYVSGFDTNTRGNQTVIVEALGKRASFIVTVKEPADPATWMPAQGGFAKNITGIAYGNGTFVAVGYNDNPGESIVARSPDGITWTRNTPGFGSPDSRGDFKISSIFFDGNEFVICGLAGESGNYTQSSPDGDKWSNMQPADNFGIQGVCTGMACGNDSLVMVFNSGRISLSGRNMRINAGGARFLDAWNSFRGVFFDGNKFIAFDEAGSYVYLGKGKSVWEIGEGSVAINGRPITEVVFGNGKFIGAGPNNALGWSIDGILWTDADHKGEALRGGDFNSVAYGFGVFVAVNSRGNIIYSRDGFAWTKVVASTFGSTNIRDLAYGNGRFVAIGDNGRIAYSNRID
jgi:hypothetical protein